MKKGMFDGPDDIAYDIRHVFFLSSDARYWVPAVNAIQARNQIPLLTLLPNSDPNYVASLLRGLRAPLYFRWGHEFNGTWYPWSGDKALKDEWRLFKKALPAGAFNVWCPNIHYLGAYDLLDFWPGESAVDIIGLDGYDQINGGPRLSAEEIFGPTMEMIRHELMSKKPIMICETATPRDDGQPAWIRDLLHFGVSRGLDSVVYFNKDKEQPWALSSRALRAFERGRP